MANEELLPVYLVVSDRDGRPCLELRKIITEPEQIKLVIHCAYYGQPITLMPTFRDVVKSLGTLVDKGILYKKNEKYFFNL
jgi:hypothetical protein